MSVQPILISSMYASNTIKPKQLLQIQQASWTALAAHTTSWYRDYTCENLNHVWLRFLGPTLRSVLRSVLCPNQRPHNPSYLQIFRWREHQQGTEGYQKHSPIAHLWILKTKLPISKSTVTARHSGMQNPSGFSGQIKLTNSPKQFPLNHSLQGTAFPTDKYTIPSNFHVLTHALTSHLTH